MWTHQHTYCVLNKYSIFLGHSLSFTGFSSPEPLHRRSARLRNTVEEKKNNNSFNKNGKASAKDTSASCAESSLDDNTFEAAYEDELEDEYCFASADVRMFDHARSSPRTLVDASTSYKFIANITKPQAATFTPRNSLEHPSLHSHEHRYLAVRAIEKPADPTRTPTNSVNNSPLSSFCQTNISKSSLSPLSMRLAPQLARAAGKRGEGSTAVVAAGARSAVMHAPVVAAEKIQKSVEVMSHDAVSTLTQWFSRDLSVVIQ
jgi:hypothetical protein